MKSKTARWCISLVGVLVLAAAPRSSAQPPGPLPPEGGVPEVAFDPPRASSRDAAQTMLEAGRWTFGGAVGLLGATPDDTGAGALMHADYFLREVLGDTEDQVSFGPLLQWGMTEDLAQVGLTAQGKYWLPVAGTQGRGRVVLQGGLGFIHADFRREDTSWLIPLGVGYDYTLLSGTTLTATALLNFTDLETGGGSNADVMPGIFFGGRF